MDRTDTFEDGEPAGNSRVELELRIVADDPAQFGGFFHACGETVWTGDCQGVVAR
ncbi:MAG: hypothetical protein Ct9H300mP13_7110 [Gammaproteobacteria bacterium]|nr:MAG: hypothetical protein Ct9H300mP13_7110 [Gammaproteobacteria bacterium]